MAEQQHQAGKLDVGALIHSSGGVLCLVLGGLMYLDGFAWAVHAFSAMMLLTFVSALIISINTDSWVAGHYLAMSPVVGVVLGYADFDWGFTVAYLLIWAAFLHFLWRGYQAVQAAKRESGTRRV
ncbi:MAG TPA: hypothetical protein VIS55_00570 [Pseudomonadales bacterium]|jgi:hypothetical protein